VDGERWLSKLMMVQVSKREVARFSQLTDDSKWLTENYDRIKRTYGGQYVAVQKKRVVDHDENLTKLRDRVKGTPIVIRYIYREKPHLIL
jgi:hypothetical protein